MTQKMPPVPPASRSDKGPGEPERRVPEEPDHGKRQEENPDKIGQAGNTKVNTTHQGGRQDR